ncbi:MAG: hypothetical protein ACRBCS_03910 [Cellvibrionaceae bacterium]
MKPAPLPSIDPLSWIKQDEFFQLLPKHLAEAALFAVNTGLRAVGLSA